MPAQLSQCEVHPSSFRDPAGFLFFRDRVLYRQINHYGYADYRLLMDTGLYGHLVEQNIIVAHEEVSISLRASDSAAVVIRPELVDFISYPYEWGFSQLKDAALMTIDLMMRSIKFGLIIKDASAYNVQFQKGRPIFIDTGSFQRYNEGQPWVAYSQFCRHFLAPLLLMAQRDIRLGTLSRQFIDGVPLDLASRLLPIRSWMSYVSLSHIHLHAIAQRAYGASDKAARMSNKVTRFGMVAMLEGIKKMITKLSWKHTKSEWGKYYDSTNYSDSAMACKTQLVSDLIKKIRPRCVWDLGGNNGLYSRIAAKSGASVICWDIDPVAVEVNYTNIRSENVTNILPLLQDLTNPSPNIGWGNNERESLASRCREDNLVMALALIHHLVISNNVTLCRVAEYFASLCDFLIVEFVPKEDSQVGRLLSTRKDTFLDYDINGFKSAFQEYFSILEAVPVADTTRTIFLMRRLKS